MGDKTGEQCYMIYNDQKHHDWFQQFMAGYGRHKRRATGNKNTAFMGQVAPPSSASEAAPRSRGVLVLPHDQPVLLTRLQHYLLLNVYSGTFAYKIASLPALKLLLVVPVKLQQEAELGPAFCTFGLLYIPACTSVQ